MLLTRESRSTLTLYASQMCGLRSNTGLPGDRLVTNRLDISRIIFSFILIRFWLVTFVGDSTPDEKLFRISKARRKRSHDRCVHPCVTMSLEQEDSSPAF